MVHVPLAAEQKGSSVANPPFSHLIAHLSSAYRDWELPAIFLAMKLDRLDVPVRIDDLAEVARRAFFVAHAGKTLDPNDRQFSNESFRNIALHAVAALQHNAVELFKEGHNEPGY